MAVMYRFIGLCP